MPGKKDAIVFVVAHPDDVAHSMGATACLLGRKYRLHVLCASKGERGMEGKTLAQAAAIREKEEAAVCRAIGAGLTFLGQIDGEVFAERAVCERVARALRRLKPRAVFTLWPVNAHPDHVAAHGIATKALQLAGLWGKVELFMSENSLSQTSQFQPDVLVDISDLVDQKKALARMHRSQNPQEEHVNRVLQRNLIRGQLAHCGFAEAFKTFVPLTVGRAGGTVASVLLDIRK